ncbi:hypothetical protein ES815_01790 [Leclercia adecarboxylata]|uniref:Peptidase M4 n=1 Tax=Leclercia adecarboxylata TaxID=83655 RepID=A0AAP9D9G0_9ENTR|nr:hypothetical protein [Leclercia adecarboxylata]QDK17103.1 hypothetical protein ES815_01790 [Leclercia adecarboxylata]
MKSYQPISPLPKPPVRRLNVYAFDPQSSVELKTAVINNTVIELPWETRWEDQLETGPINDYLEVIDYDPSSGLFYTPTDLNDPFLLAQDGLPPSEGNPQYHQQMVFAVAMRTIRNFERALGRLVLWAGDRNAPKSSPERNFTRRLRIYPHALREMNAYYSPTKRALLFGYFKHPEGDVASCSWVFTCLSQDIIAHETTHAILHGMQQRSIEASNLDSLAFHEAFADIIALLQHFSMTNVVRHQLAQNKGSLREPGLLNGLALQFGHATGCHGALRYALQYLSTSATATEGGEHNALSPPKKLSETFESHERGGFLVAAIFDAFVTIYEQRTADLFRLAFSGAASNQDYLPTELVNRLAIEAAKAADQVLRMCVRALDYIPPVDLHFGEYLRAIITADTDLVAHDPMRYRIAFVEAFKKRGITVPGCISMAPESLLWDEPDLTEAPEFGSRGRSPEEGLSNVFSGLLNTLELSGSIKPGEPGATGGGRRNLREAAMLSIQRNQARIHAWFEQDSPFDEGWEKLLGMRLIAFDNPIRKSPVPLVATLWTGRATQNGEFSNVPTFEVHSARIARRVGPEGQETHQLIIQITQKRRGFDDPADQEKADAGNIALLTRDPDFWFRGGATIHIDLRDGKLIRIIRKNVCDNKRLAVQRAFRTGQTLGLAPGLYSHANCEPFAFLHRGL